MDHIIEKFKKGCQYVNIVSSVTDKELTSVDTYNDYFLKKSCVKFMPASGAATRMFKDLYEYLDNHQETDFISHFFESLENFAFYHDLEALIKIDKKTTEGKVLIIKTILEDGLNWGNLPKALIKIHDYEGQKTTPIDEHVYEGLKHMNQASVDLHFTISKAHEKTFNDYTKKYKHKHVNITYSFQKKQTDTMAVDLNNEPFMIDGKILYRPGGHGALIENLNDLDADIIFIKNIDNVCHRDHSQKTIEYKKKLASIGLETKMIIDDYMIKIEKGHVDLNEITRFIEENLHIKSKNTMTLEKALKFLDRPLRVCGVVKNQGEPGGGPFLVDNGDYLDLQICEKVELDLEDPSMVEILNASQYFNPVDLVCFTKDYKGEKYNLLDFINEDRYFISEKTYKGRKLKALEHPGLWNGAMHHWNTIFVEVPLLTFNPIKNVNDLLRAGHVREYN